MGRNRALYCAFGLALYAVASAPISWADVGPKAPTVAEARKAFGSLVDAAIALGRVRPMPGDQNGQVRRWDRRWKPVISRIDDRYSVLAVVPKDAHDCKSPEISALLGGATLTLGLSRDGLLNDEGFGFSLEELALEFANRRWAADEAANRRRRRLSCEDLSPYLDHFPAISQGDTAVRPLFGGEEPVFKDADAALEYTRLGKVPKTPDRGTLPESGASPGDAGTH